MRGASSAARALGLDLALGSVGSSSSSSLRVLIGMGIPPPQAPSALAKAPRRVLLACAEVQASHASAVCPKIDAMSSLGPTHASPQGTSEFEPRLRHHHWACNSPA